MKLRDDECSTQQILFRRGGCRRVSWKISDNRYASLLPSSRSKDPALGHGAWQGSLNRRYQLRIKSTGLDLKHRTRSMRSLHRRSGPVQVTLSVAKYALGNERSCL